MNEQILINSTFPYLVSYFKEYQSFYPFAMFMDKDMNVLLISPEIDDEFPTSEYLINLYEEGIRKEYAVGNNYVLAVICIDVVIRNKYDETGDTNAIEFRLIDSKLHKSLYLVYSIDESNNVLWGDWIGDRPIL